MAEDLPWCEWRQQLAPLPPFNRLNPDVLDLLLQAMREESFEAGDLLVREGERGDFLLVLLDGEARASLRGQDRLPRPFATFRRGDVVGEMALLTDEPRNATVAAQSPIRALRLAAGRFRELAARYPEVAVVLTHLIADRLGERSVDGLGGKRFDRYVILRAVARGGMSVVYEALEEDAGRTVALKMMSHRLVYEPGATQRFEREAEILLTLDHPNVARTFRRFQAYKTHFIAMEYCDGPDLKAIIDEHAPLSEPDARAILGQIGRALRYLRRCGVVHGDLKPDNVISTSAGTLKLTDFGLARPTASQDTALSVTGKVVRGTPLYMAPEQFTATHVDASVDLYALGCMAFELLAGTPLHTGRSWSELMVEKLGVSAPLPEAFPHPVSEEMYALIRTCLEPAPDRRTPDLDAVASWALPLPPGLRDTPSD